MLLKSSILILSLIICSITFAADPNLTITSSAFSDGQDIPSKYTCSGKNINPPLTIKNVPFGTQSMVLVLHDPDAPTGDFYHWTVYNIKPTTKEIAEDSIPSKELINSFYRFSYGGPCPPGDEKHHYVFDLYALDLFYTMNENGNTKGLLQKIEGHILAKASLTGLYKR